MKIVRRRTDRGPKLAVVDGEDLIDLPGTDQLPQFLGSEGKLQELAGQGLDHRREVSALADAELMAPLDPPTFRDFSTFPEHTAGVVKMLDPAAGIPPQFWEIPTFYFSNPYAITGPNDDVPISPGSKLFDFELEVAAVVGAAGQDLDVEEAADHIAGYVLLNDFSARDLQFHEMQLKLGPAKGKDGTTVLGPYFVTADELASRSSGPSFDLKMEVAVNGQVIGTDTLHHMAWSFPALAAYASRGTWIRPGDLLGSGTCQGGCLAELWGRHGREAYPPLSPGDHVTATVEILGQTRNMITTGVASRSITPWVTS